MPRKEISGRPSNSWPRSELGSPGEQNKLVCTSTVYAHTYDRSAGRRCHDRFLLDPIRRSIDAAQRDVSVRPWPTDIRERAGSVLQRSAVGVAGNVVDASAIGRRLKFRCHGSELDDGTP